MLNSRLYDVLKYVMQIALPGAGTLYFTFSQIWHLPYGAEVVGSITAIDAFLGLLLKISSNAYNNSEAKFDGVIHVEGDNVQMSSADIQDVVDKGKGEAVFKVKQVAPVKKAAKKAVKKTVAKVEETS